MGLLLNISCILLGASLILAAEARNLKPQPCNDIPGETLKRILFDDSELHSSFYGLDSIVNTMNNTLETFQTIYYDKVNIKYGNVDKGSDNCETADLSNPCPEKWVINYDENRFPKTLLEARCLCNRSQCLATSGTKCQPVRHYFPVLRRTECRKHLGTFAYQKVLEPIALSCACKKDMNIMGKPRSESGK